MYLKRCDHNVKTKKKPLMGAIMPWEFAQSQLPNCAKINVKRNTLEKVQP